MPGHRGIVGNEIADSHADKAVCLIGPHQEPAIRYLSAVKRLTRKRLQARWDQLWEDRNQSRGTAKLNPCVSRAVRLLHSGRQKGHSALLIQLRTEVVGFNSFLFKRRVPSVPSPRCACGLGTMTVQHVLLSCPIWSALRRRVLGALWSTDIREILNNFKGATAAIQFVLQTNLLAQFSLVAGDSHAIRR